MKARYFSLLLLAPLVMANDGCSPAPAQEQVSVSESQKAQEAANSLHFSENSEINNIKARLQLTADPGLLGYVALINKVGQVVLYTPVKGKITSGGKRLTAPEAWQVHNCGQYNCQGLVQMPSDEGTFGSSNPYIYFWTTDGQYIQTSMDYVYSNSPLRLSEDPLVVVGAAKP